MADIAALASVSIPTVSKVLNGRSDVALHTRERIERLIEERGFVGNKAAQALKKGRTGLIDLVVYNLTSTYDLEIIRGVQETLMQTGMRLVLTATHGQTYDEREWLSGLVRGGTDGVIIVLADRRSVALEEIRRRGVPVVVVDHSGDLDTDIPSIAAGNWAGGRTATQHLLALGHRRIGVIVGSPAIAAARDRLAGYRSALDAAGIPSEPTLVRQGSFGVDALDTAYREANALLASPHPPTAIVAGNDEQALGVYRALYEQNRRVPEDMSVVGFDDALLAALAVPSLTTIRQPLAEMGQLAVVLLLRLIEGKLLDSTRVELATSLIQRASCGPPRAAMTRDPA